MYSFKDASAKDTDKDRVGLFMIVIKECKGYELEKSKSNTSEDFFNKSLVLYEADGEEKKLEILYLRYFDEIKDQFTPFTGDPIFEAGERKVQFKDIVALAALIKHPEYKNRKSVYINSVEQISALLKDLPLEKIKEVFQSLESSGKYVLKNSEEFASTGH